MRLLEKRVLRLRLRTWGLVALIIPFFVWGGLNVLFSTSWGTGILCDKVEQRTGLPCRLGSVTWSPWAGVTVSQFRVFASEDAGEEEAIFSVDETRVDVSWSSLLKGKKRWERLEVDGLDVNVSIETIREVLGRSLKAPAKPSGTTRPADEDVVPVPVPAPDSEDQTSDQNPADPPVVRKEVPANRGEDHSASTPVDDFEGVVILSNARVKIYSERVPAFSLTLNQIAGEFPLWGGRREGEVSCERVEISEEISEAGLTIPLVWRDRSLSVLEHPLKVFGLNLELSAAVQLTAGFPVGFKVDLPDQQLDLSSIFRGEKSPLSVGELSASNRLHGYLLSPASFRGSSVTRFKDVVFHDPRDTGEMRFDRGGAKLVASVAGIVARDIRAVGEEDAILMNGFVKSTGEAAATIRIVSSPQRAESHAKRVRMADGNLLMDFQPLMTPDREFRDIRIEARDGTLMMDLGEDRSWVSFFATAKAILGRQSTEFPNLP